MKLYTENQMIQAYESGRGLTHEEVLEQFVPIQLPTDEESAIIALKIADTLKDKLTSSQEAFFLSGFQTYAKWMRDKIKGGQDE